MAYRIAACRRLLYRRRMDVSDKWLPGCRCAARCNDPCLATVKNLAAVAAGPLGGGRHRWVANGLVGWQCGVVCAKRGLCCIRRMVCFHCLDDMDFAETSCVVPRCRHDGAGRIHRRGNGGRAGGGQLGRCACCLASSGCCCGMLANGNRGRRCPPPFVARLCALAMAPVRKPRPSGL